MQRLLAVAAVFGGLAIAERVWPLRRRTQPSARRMVANAAFGAIGAAASGALMQVVTPPRRHRSWAARLAGVVLLDYTLWHWHRLMHRVPSLWAMHAAHHADQDLDVSTALRFHAGELIAAVPFRLAQVLLLRTDRATLRAWETATLVAIAFHHSNLRLPERLDRALGWLVITPRLHGIHHAARPQRLHTNFGTLLSAWDVLHRTRDRSLDQRALAVGLPRNLGQPTPGVVESLVLPLSPELVQR